MLASLAMYLHKIDPYAIGPIRWYGLSYLLGFFIAYLLVRRVAQVGVTPLKPLQASDLVITLALGVVAGGRLGYALFYQPALFWTFSDTLPYWDLLATNRGGMASHGGMIGLIVASWWFARKQHIPWAHVLDLGAFGAPLGLFFGRLANFVNGELFGRPAPADLPWGVKFPQELYHADPAFLMGLQEQLPAPPDVVSQSWGAYVDWIITQVQAGNQQVIQVLEPHLTVRHPSQLYEALLEGLVLFSVLAWVWRKPRKPMMIGGSFCLCYGLLRIVVEFFREPDEGIALQLGLSRGQWLSILLALAGAALLFIFNRRKVEPLGGWRKTV